MAVAFKVLAPFYPTFTIRISLFQQFNLYMDRIPLSPPIIHPIPESESRPLWSVMIPVYNCAKYLPETLESVLIQQLSEEDMQIEVVDDASSDADVEAIVKRIGKGRVTYFRQPENVGSLRNFETCLNRAQGQLVHLLHGDDRIKPGFYEELGQLFAKYPEVGAAFSRFSFIDENGLRLYDQPIEMNQKGVLRDWLLDISENNRIQYAAIAIRRQTYEKLGSFYGITYGEDWEMWTRIARSYPIAYTPTILADYRKHMNSISGSKHIYGDYLGDVKRAMEYIQGHLPVDQRAALLRKSKKFHSHHGLRLANEVWHITYDKKATMNLIKQMLSLHQDYKLYYEVSKLLIKMSLHS
jgi:glycosyltransferase involved in cell wall biosynthesis